jgi:hypothetical protein
VAVVVYLPMDQMAFKLEGEAGTCRLTSGPSPYVPRVFMRDGARLEGRQAPHRCVLHPARKVLLSSVLLWKHAHGWVSHACDAPSMSQW